MRDTTEPFTTTPIRAAASLAIGAVTGGAAVGIGICLMSVVASLVRREGAEFEGSLIDLASLALLFGGYATVVYAVGLVALGAPAWALLHLLGLRRRRHAAVLGAALNGATVAAFMLAGSHSRPSGAWLGSIGMVVIFAALGAVLGVVIWRCAYDLPRR